MDLFSDLELELSVSVDKISLKVWDKDTNTRR